MIGAIKKDALELVARLKRAYLERSPGYAPEPASGLPEQYAQPTLTKFLALGFEPEERALAVTAARWFSEECPSREGFANFVTYQVQRTETTTWRESGVIYVAHERYFYDHQGQGEEQ